MIRAWKVAPLVSLLWVTSVRSDPFEAPENPDIHVRTDKQTVAESAAFIVNELEKRGLIPVAEPA